MDQPGFNDVTPQPISPFDSNPNPYGTQIFPSLQVGTGKVAFKVDRQGLWLGADKFINAPFSVDMLGHVIINDANITITNDQGQTIIDATGLVSGSNFQSDSIADTSLRTTSAGVAVDLPNTTLVTPNFPRAVKVFVTYSVTSYLGGIDPTTQGLGQFSLNVDGTPDDDLLLIVSDTAVDFAPFVYSATYGQSISKVLTLAAGVHTIKVQYVGYQELNCERSALTYLVLGS